MAKTVSIIIPVREVDKFTEECLEKCRKLDYPEYEILLLPDYAPKTNISGVRVIPTGAIKPSEKRNLGVSKSNSEIIAFIDSDAYPLKDWLKKAVTYFENPDVGGVGGPNLTPPNDSLLSKIGGDILSNPAAAGLFALRYKVMAGRYVKELPSCNLLVRRDVFNKIGGFDVAFLTAEDSKLCFEIRGQGKGILYANDVLVYHHRRPLFKPHLKQMWIYGRDKGKLLRSFLSLRMAYYFIPSLFLLSLLFLAVSSILFQGSLIGVISQNLFLFVLGAYVIILLISSIIQNPKYFYIVFLGSLLTHLYYGIGFIYGLLLFR